MSEPAVPDPPIDFVEELQPGQPGRVHLFFVSPGGKEDTYHRRLTNALGPHWPATLLHPVFTPYSRDLYAVDRVADTVEQAIRVTRPTGPFVLIGFCYAGLFAFEVAARLASAGCTGAVLIDSPMPGFPQFLPSRTSARAYRRLARALLLDQHRPKRSTAAFWMAQKLLWYTVLALRPVLQPFQASRLGRLPAKLALVDNVDFLKIRRLPVPLLNIVAKFPLEPFYFRQACLDWDQVAGAGATVHVVPCDHTELFFRGNVPILASALLDWLQSLYPSSVNRSASGPPEDLHEQSRSAPYVPRARQ